MQIRSRILGCKVKHNFLYFNAFFEKFYPDNRLFHSFCVWQLQHLNLVPNQAFCFFIEYFCLPV